MEPAAILIRVFAAFALAVGGGVVSALVGLSHQRLCALISLAAGTLLGVTLFAILPEAAQTLPWWQVLLALASGYVVFVLISRYVYHVCPACAASHFDEATSHRFSEIAGALIIALAIHSTMDGIALAAGHELAGGGHGLGLDATMVLAVCAHKLPEGLALGALLLGAGFRRGSMLAWVAAVAQNRWLPLVLAHAGGGFLFLAAHAVLGELVKHGKRIVLTSFLGGVVLIGLVRLIVR